MIDENWRKPVVIINLLPQSYVRYPDGRPRLKCSGWSGQDLKIKEI